MEDKKQHFADDFLQFAMELNSILADNNIAEIKF
jgi:hypothetical protein